MNDQQVRAWLDEEAEQVRARWGDLRASFDDIVDAAKDSNLDDEHDPEGATIAATRSQVSALAQQAERSLAAIDAARARLEAGTYGTCTGCGGAIAPERLEARPATPWCIDCARKAG